MSFPCQLPPSSMRSHCISGIPLERPATVFRHFDDSHLDTGRNEVRVLISHRGDSTGLRLSCIRRQSHRNKKVAGEKIGKQMSERWRTTQLACRNPSIRLTPLPTVSGSTLQPFPQIRDGHRINVDANILREETCEGLQKFAFEIAVNVFKRSNHHGKTADEAYSRLRMAVYQSGHVVKLGFTK